MFGIAEDERCYNKYFVDMVTQTINQHSTRKHTHTQHMHSQSITFDRNDNYTNRSNIFETEKNVFVINDLSARRTTA